MKKYLIIILSFLFIFYSCEESLEEVNINENQPIEPNPAALLPSTIIEPANSFVNVSFWITDILMQYESGAFGIGNEVGRYDFNLELITDIDPWRAIYASFSNLEDLERSALELELPAYQAAAKILRSVYAAGLSEMFMNVPYSEAGKGAEGITQPEYDTQEAIYNGILQELNDANSLLSNSAEFSLGGDILYGGDVSKWRKLANSLRLRYLLRISNISATAASEINEIYSNPLMYPIFEGIDDEGVYDFTGVFPNVTDVANGRIPEFSYLSAFFVDTFSPLDDPRLDFFGNLPSSPEITDFVGLPSGLSEEEATSFNGGVTENVSTVTTRFQTEGRGLLDYAFMTFSEVQFILAEAAMKGWISADAEQFYLTGIRSNFDYWGIEVSEDYLVQPGVVWANNMEQLINQKWLASYKLNTVEIWGEYKRTGLPTILPGTSAILSTIPTRIRYPLIEQSVNPQNYSNAVSALGGDELDIAPWYQ